MRFGVVVLPELPWATQQSVWRSAEDLVFAHAWTYDHLAWRSLADSPWFATVPTLAAAAIATSRIRLGTLVASPNFRNPVLFAKELMTLDDISAGRITAGIGAGGLGFDATVLGHESLSASGRADRLEEFVDLTDRLLRTPKTTFRGRFFVADEARTIPGCVQSPRVPFAIAATGPRGMRLAAAQGQSWVTTGDPRRGDPIGAEDGARTVQRQMALLEDACAEVGRDPATIDRMVLLGASLDQALTSEESFSDAAGRYEAVGVTDLVVHWPRSDPPFDTDQRVFERIFSR